MFIFWKLVFVEDAPLYTRDFSAKPEMDNTTYIPTDMDWIINMFGGLVLLMCFVVACPLNYIVYRFNLLKRANLTNYLSKSLSLVDLLTTGYGPCFYAGVMFSSELYPCNTHLLTITRQLVCVLGCASQVITWVLAVTRFFRVIVPFAVFRRKSILIYIVVYCTLMTINSASSLALQISGAEERVSIMAVVVGFCFIGNLVHCCTGIIVSVVTSVYLLWCSYLQRLTLQRTFQEHCNKKTSISRQRKSSVTILLMNIPNFITICFIIYVNAKPGQISFHDAFFGFLPILTSAVNPIIVSARNYAKIKRAFFRLKKVARTVLSDRQI